MLSTLIGSIVIKSVLHSLDVDVSDFGLPDWLTDILI